MLIFNLFSSYYKQQNENLHHFAPCFLMAQKGFERFFSLDADSIHRIGSSSSIDSYKYMLCDCSVTISFS